MKLRVYIGFILAVALVLIIGVNSYNTFKKQYTEAGNLRHSYKVLDQFQTVQSILVSMESGRRAFRSTNEKRFLEPYKNGLTQIDPAIAKLKELVTQREIKERIPQLERDINRIRNFWKSIGDDATNFSMEYVTALMDREKSLMDVIRKEIENLTKIEENVLAKIERDNARSVRFASTALIASVILTLIIVGALIYLILKEFTTRKKAELELKENNFQLEEAHAESNEKNWLLEGVAEINNSLHEKTDEHSLSQSILDAIINYLKVDAGGFYLYDKETETLQLMGRHGLPTSANSEYKLGEGLIGNVAVKKETLIIEDISSHPLQHNTITGHDKPIQGLYMPIYSNEELKVVIELLSLKSFSEQDKKLLDVACSNIGLAVNSAQASKSILNLLKQVQEQKEALEQQQEELRQANEELSHQAEGLQHSEEELKVQEEELRQINAELEEKNEAVETARQALELKAKELEVTGKYKSEFLANMSHELRTPLNSVLILARLLSDNKEHNLNEKQVSHAKIIHKSGSDLLQLINEILDLSKIEAGKIDLNFENVSVKSIASDIEQLFNIVAEEKSIRFTVTTDDNVPESIQTDKQRIEQVLKNLLSNAFKFTEADGEIILNFSLAVDGNKPLLQMTVSDSGIGISAERQQGIFEAFQQADGATNRKYGGTGLGLSISKELVQMLGGVIYVDSEEGKGSVFKVNVPLYKTIVRDEEKDGARLPQLQFSSSHNATIIDDRANIKPGDKVLLVIEDDDMFAKIVRQFGFSHGFKTILALNGTEGLQLAKRHKPGAIILDINLPDIDGGTVLQMIKSDNNLKNIPVHIISAKEDTTVLPGAFAYLQKPLSKKDLDNVFLLIGEIMKGAVKKVLLISNGNLKDNVLNNLISNRQLEVQFDIAVSMDDAIEKIKIVKYDTVIADIGKNVAQGITSLKILNEHLKQEVPIIIYLDEDITPGDDLQLKKISDVVVRSSSSSPERLMDELELFLYKVQQDTSSTEQVAKTTNTIVLGDQALKGRKVLLVDDDMRNIFALTAALEPEQMEIHTASDGKEALQIVSDMPDLSIILMDIMMPNMDGYQAMTHIRKDMALTEIPIIALTAKAMTEDKEKCIAAGASDYISKPVDIQKLKSLMRVWLSQ